MKLPVWLNECVPVFRYAVKRRSMPGSSRFTATAGAALLLLSIFALMFTQLSAWQAVCFGAGLPLAGLLSATFLHYMSGAALQNTPANAALVPRMNRLLRRTAAMLWCAALLGWAMVGAVVPHGALIVLVAALALSMLALGRGGRSEGIVVFMVGDLVLVTGGKPLRDFVEQPLVLTIAVGLAVLVSWHVLRLMFPQAGEVTIEADAKRKRLLSVAARSSSKDFVRLQATRSRRPVYARVLARDAARRRPGPLMMHALGPTGHRYYIAVPAVIGAMGLALARLAVLTLAPALPHDTGMTAFVMVMATLFAAVVLLGSVARYGRVIAYFAEEQALVRLAPGVPRPFLLNRVLATEVVRALLVEWVLYTGLLIAVLAYWQVSGEALQRIFILMCCTLIPLGWLPLRDHAARAQVEWRQGLGVSVLMTAGAAAALLVTHKVAMALVLALVLAAAWLIGAARWRKMMAAPPAFPAQRGA